MRWIPNQTAWAQIVTPQQLLALCVTLGNSFKPPRASVSSSVEWGDNCGTHAWVLPPPTGLAPLRAAQCHRWSEGRCGTGGGTWGCLGLRHDLSPPPLRRDSRHRRNAARGRGCVPTQLPCATAGGRARRPQAAGPGQSGHRTPPLFCAQSGGPSQRRSDSPQRRGSDWKVRLCRNRPAMLSPCPAVWGSNGRFS